MDRHRLPKTQLLKTPALRFCVDEKKFENGTFRKPASDCDFSLQVSWGEAGGGRGTNSAAAIFSLTHDLSDRLSASVTARYHDVDICVHNCHLYMSVVPEINPRCQGFQNTVCA